MTIPPLPLRASSVPLTVLATLASMALSPVRAAGDELEPSDVESFDAFVAQSVERFGLAGAAVAVVDDGEVLLARGYGRADRESGAPVTTDTRFNIGSVSKLLAAWGVLRLVDQGLVELDAPIQEYVHTWQLPDSSFDVEGVTVRRLLSHTAGLSLHGYPGFALDEPLPSLTESLSGATNGAEAVELIAEPGSMLRYSGGGYSLLQLMCEELTEKPFPTYMREVCFVPLGMQRTGFNREARLEEGTARPHDLLRGPIPDHAFRAEAAAAAYTTLDDFVRFALAHFDMGPDEPAGRSVMAPGTVALLGQVVPETGGRWGHGAMILGGSDTAGGPVFGHGGDNPGWHALIALHPSTRDALIVLTNGDAGPALREYLQHPWSVLVGIEPPLAAFRPPAAIAVLGTLLQEGGGAAVGELLQLREEGSGDYDFEPGYHAWVADGLLEAGRTEDALELLALGVDLYPGEANLWAGLARARHGTDDDEGARVACEQALELEPGHGAASALLATLD